MHFLESELFVQHALRLHEKKFTHKQNTSSDLKRWLSDTSKETSQLYNLPLTGRFSPVWMSWCVFSASRVARNPSVTPRLRNATGRENAADLFRRRGIEALPEPSVPLYCLWPEPHHFTRLLLRHRNPTHLLVGLFSPLRRQLRGESDSFWKVGEEIFDVFPLHRL